MQNVFQIKDAAEKRRAARIKKDETLSQPPDEPDGVIQFTHTDQGSLMRITGTYAEAPQFGLYTLIKGASDLIERCGDGLIPKRSRSLPRRLRETGFGDLE